MGERWEKTKVAGGLLAVVVGATAIQKFDQMKEYVSDMFVLARHPIITYRVHRDMRNERYMDTYEKMDWQITRERNAPYQIE